MQQLDLFDWRPSAEIVMFPLTRRRALIRDAAARMLCMTDREVVAYWGALAREVGDPLFAAGIARDVVREQVSDLYGAVAGEVAKIFWGDDEDEPCGGTA